MSESLALAPTTEQLPAVAEALAAPLADLAGQLAPRSRRIYMSDANHFANWMRDRGTAVSDLTRSTMIEYRSHLAENYAKATAGRMLIVARRLLNEAVLRGELAANPAADVKGFAAGSNETPHTALTRGQVRELLAAIDLEAPDGRRDYALIMLLLRTGLRRSEASALDLGDLGQEQGYNVLTVQHGKGDKRRKAKLHGEVVRAIEEYMKGAGRAGAAPGSPLFIRFRTVPGGTRAWPTEERLGEDGIERIVKARAAAIGVKLTPHGLRASFVTLALEGGASLHQVQYAAGHADPRTTERYQKRKVNLDDNAVDYIRV